MIPGLREGGFCDCPSTVSCVSLCDHFGVGAFSAGEGVRIGREVGVGVGVETRMDTPFTHTVFFSKMVQYCLS